MISENMMHITQKLLYGIRHLNKNVQFAINMVTRGLLFVLNQINQINNKAILI